MEEFIKYASAYNLPAYVFGSRAKTTEVSGPNPLDFPCNRHSSSAGTRCNVRIVSCAYRRALARNCPKCGVEAGTPCRSLSTRQTWEPEPHMARRQSQTKHQGGK